MNSWEQAATFQLLVGVLIGDVRIIYGMLGWLVLLMLIRWKKKQLKRIQKKIKKRWRKIYNSINGHKHKKKNVRQQG